MLALVGQGLSNEDIAAHLMVSPHTVKTHVNRAMTKLGAHDRAQLVVIAYETGPAQPAAHADPFSAKALGLALLPLYVGLEAERRRAAGRDRAVVRTGCGRSPPRRTG